MLMSTTHRSTHAVRNDAVNVSQRTFLWYGLVWLRTARPDELGEASMFFDKQLSFAPPTTTQSPGKLCSATNVLVTSCCSLLSFLDLKFLVFATP